MGKLKTLDDQDRIYIPKGVQRQLGWEPEEHLELSVEDGAVVIRKWEPEDKNKEATTL